MEAIAELIAAIVMGAVSAVVAVLEIVLTAVFTLIEFAFVAVTQGKEAASERRNSRRLRQQQERQSASASVENSTTVVEMARVAPSQAAGSAIIAGIVLIVVAATAIGFYLAEQTRKQRVETTRKQIAQIADKLAAQLKDKAANDPEKGRLQERDAWNQPLELFVDKTLLGSMLVVRPHGNDGKSGTLDDMLAIRIVRARVAEIGGQLAKRGFDKVKDRLQKLLLEKDVDVIPIDIDFAD